jgi:hypothetical protein
MRQLGIIAALFALAAPASATIIVRWGFNNGNAGPLNSPVTAQHGVNGDIDIVPGAAVVSRFPSAGPTTFGFGAGNDPIAGSDPATGASDRKGSFGSFGTTAPNASRGAQFIASTQGYYNAVFVLDTEHALGTSRWWRVDYTTNGSTWTTYNGTINTVNANGTINRNTTNGHIDLQSTSAIWLRHTMSFANLPVTDDAAVFGIRLLMAHAPGTTAYTQASGGSFTAAGLSVDWAYIDATKLPEPSTALMGAVGVLGLLAARFGRKHWIQ